jgi:hypothetical protein
MTPKRIPIKAAETVGKEHGCRQVILLAFDGELTHIVTWGNTVEDCAQAAQGGNLLKAKWGWPADTKSQPSRVQAILKAIAKRQDEVGHHVSYAEMENIANA